MQLSWVICCWCHGSWVFDNYPYLAYDFYPESFLKSSIQTGKIVLFAVLKIYLKRDSLRFGTRRDYFFPGPNTYILLAVTIAYPLSCVCQIQASWLCMSLTGHYFHPQSKLLFPMVVIASPILLWSCWKWRMESADRGTLFITLDDVLQKRKTVLNGHPTHSFAIFTSNWYIQLYKQGLLPRLLFGVFYTQLLRIDSEEFWMKSEYHCVKGSPSISSPKTIVRMTQSWQIVITTKYLHQYLQEIWAKWCHYADLHVCVFFTLPL